MWFKVDDGFAFHPKAIAAGPALGVWVRAGSWSGFHLTDGAIPRHMLIALGGKPKDAAALVAAGLWETTETGWVFHDWLDYNPSKAQVQSQKAWDRQRMELHRDRALVAAIRRRDADRCRYCGHQVRWNVRRGPYAATYDWLDPQGGNSLDNVVVACGPCNLHKDGRTLAAAEMELLAPGSVGREPAANSKVTDLFAPRTEPARSKNSNQSDQNPDPTRPDPSSSLREEEDGSTGPVPVTAPESGDDIAAAGRAAMALARQEARRKVARFTSASHALPAVRTPAPTGAPRLREPESTPAPAAHASTTAQASIQ